MKAELEYIPPTPAWPRPIVRLTLTDKDPEGNKRVLKEMARITKGWP